MISTSRLITHPRHHTLKAFTTPELLAQWWGPKGFSNTFESCDIRPHGKRVFVMHGPTGVDYPNQSQRLVVEESRIVIEHLSDPHFFLEVGFEEVPDGTLVSWTQTFDSAEIEEQVRGYAESANEENLDRLQEVLDTIQH